MHGITRRSFLEATSAAFGSAAVPGAFAAQAPPQREAAKIFTVLFGIAPSRDDSAIEIGRAHV